MQKRYWWLGSILSIITALIASILLTTVLGSVKSLKLPAVEVKYITNITNADGKIYYSGKIKIKFKTTATLSGEKLTVNNYCINCINFINFCSR
jgi:hypothetical protein